MESNGGCVRSSGGDFLLLLVDVDDAGLFALHCDKGGTTTSFLLILIDVNNAEVFPVPCNAQHTVASVFLMLIDIDNVAVSALHFGVLYRRRRKTPSGPLLEWR
jgi:hypothetical protein